MTVLPGFDIEGLAHACVGNMGDVFWDYIPARDLQLGYSEPQQLAVNAVAVALLELIESMESNPVVPNTLRMEYREIIARAGVSADDSMLITALVANAALSRDGAEAILHLAKHFGAGILRNALALAEAMNLENGDAVL